ncbi:hypothetical protein [Tissierella praeacuta]|uniref:hypothetical protein n=1 Tax=Tissierella praeacuta TaxID=43131 RepID=UPI001C1292CF|nr:hypothetical protein [Tissierella praeacuta]MBU5257066.1 hypothetical protein [Tissierella praeacuta]
MINRSNPEDIFKTVKEDFNWLKEDIYEHLEILKGKIIELVNEDLVEEIDEYKEKHEDLKKILEKIDEVRNEYISIIKGEEQSQFIQDTEYDYLEDWTGTDPMEISLFGQRYSVKYWRDILLILMEELYKKDKGIIADILRNDDYKERARVPFTYEHNKINKKYYKKTSYGLFVLVNDNANTIYSRCIRVLEIAGFKEQDLKVKLSDTIENESNQEVNIENNSTDNGTIKLSKKYGSISIDKSLFKTIVNSIVNRKVEYGTDYIEPRKIVEKYESLILKDTKYTVAYHVVINIVKFLMDIHFLDNYRGTKKGKYIIVDDNSLKAWIDKNI